MKNEQFTVSEIKKNMKTPCDVVIYSVADSSNRIAKDSAVNGAKEGTVVIVEKQTDGRGRLGRKFVSESDKGLYLSIILRPLWSINESTKITVIGALAVAKAIYETSGRKTEIKWVNDVYIKDKKVSGILTESSFDYDTDKLNYAVIGIGVNVSVPNGGFDKSVENIACAVFDEAPKNYKAILCGKIIDNFFEYYNDINNRKYIVEYREKSNLIGKDVKVVCGEKNVYGKVVNIDDEFALLVETENGIEKFTSGEASVRKTDI